MNILFNFSELTHGVTSSTVIVTHALIDSEDESSIVKATVVAVAVAVTVDVCVQPLSMNMPSSVFASYDRCA
jgi:hypothetical protein